MAGSQPNRPVVNVAFDSLNRKCAAHAQARDIVMGILRRCNAALEKSKSRADIEYYASFRAACQVISLLLFDMFLLRSDLIS